jgi:DNA-binding PadR family transcriptional regulator
MEAQGLISGRWVEKAGERRRRFYRLSAAGQAALDAERKTWRAFVDALTRVARLRQA